MLAQTACEKRNKGTFLRKKIFQGISADQLAPVYWGDLYAGSNSMCKIKRKAVKLCKKENYR